MTPPVSAAKVLEWISLPVLVYNAGIPRHAHGKKAVQKSREPFGCVFHSFSLNKRPRESGLLFLMNRYRKLRGGDQLGGDFGSKGGTEYDNRLQVIGAGPFV